MPTGRQVKHRSAQLPLAARPSRSPVHAFAHHLADDHPVVRAGLRAVLETEPGMVVVAEAATA
ncbi:hypothetical protein ACWDX8_39010, partial [Streptomyces anthocyanicus]